MAYLRLVSSSTKEEYVISTRIITGYHIHPSSSVTLYTQSDDIEIYFSPTKGWDNWDEFIEKLKAEFEESNEDF